MHGSCTVTWKDAFSVSASEVPSIITDMGLAAVNDMSSSLKIVTVNVAALKLIIPLSKPKYYAVNRQ